MNESKAEGLNLIDLMILVAMTGVGLSYAVQGEPWIIFTLPTNRLNVGSYQRNLAVTVHTLWLSWTVAWLAIGLRWRRTMSLRLCRGPAWVACLLATLGVGCHWFEAATWQYRTHVWDFAMGIPYAWIWYMANTPSLLVSGACFALWWCGQWRAERSNFDRIGRILGFGWIAFGLANRVSFVFEVS